MNHLKHKHASDSRVCSPGGLIWATESVGGRTHAIERNGNGNSPAALPDMAIGRANRTTGSARHGEAFPENGGSEGARRIEQSIAYMREHLNQPLPVAKLAALVNVSPSHFFALFKRLTGSAPMDYFKHLRMQHACRLLGGTSASVKEVAALLGYDDPFYFSRAFKAVNRIPPSRYRALQEQPSPILCPDKIGSAEGGRGAKGNGVAAVSWPGKGRNQNSRIVHSQ